MATVLAAMATIPAAMSVVVIVRVTPVTTVSRTVTTGTGPLVTARQMFVWTLNRSLPRTVSEDNLHRLCSKNVFATKPFDEDTVQEVVET